MIFVRRALALPRRQNWHNLGAFATKDRDIAAWRDLRARESQVSGVVGRQSSASPGIDWPMWEKSIGHSQLVQSMKAFYEQQSSLLCRLSQEDHKSAVAKQQAGWDLYQQAKDECEHAVEKSESLVGDGAKALWLGYQNPPAWKVDANEWLESDQYWQAYVEKHHHYDPAKDIANYEAESFECENQEEADKKRWHREVNLLHDRLDTPKMYVYMNELHSWEYYDLHRRALLEHGLYYLLRSGGDMDFFPELPPNEQLTHIEDLRYKFISVAQRRRAHFQLAGNERERGLDLLPTDLEHYGEEATLKLLQNERNSWEMMAGRLMGCFALFCEPYVPCQTTSALIRAMNKDDGQGKIFTLGKDVNCLFYLPTDTTLPRPSAALAATMDYLAITGRRLNPAYAQLLGLADEVFESRGPRWLVQEGEGVSGAFLRRLRRDDPAKPVFAAYISEMQQRWAATEELTQEVAAARIVEIEEEHTRECELYEQLRASWNAEVAALSKAEVSHMSQLEAAGELQTLINEGSYVAVQNTASDRHVLQSSRALLSQLSAYQEVTDVLVDSINGLKMPALEAQRKL